MDKQFYKDTFGWGLVLWLIGYVLGFVFFFFVPASVIGWVIMPIGILITLWVLLKKIINNKLRYYLFLAVIWTLLAVVLDYFLLVKALKPADGYYKLDVYIYYALIFILPLLVGWRKNQKASNTGV